MKLTHVEIKNYRSLFHDYEADQSFEVELGDGVNAITGPNNTGKSNILRAIALALDPDFEFNRRLDIPSVYSGSSKPVVTLTFKVPARGRSSRETTLLKRLREYEKQVNPKAKRTYAQQGEVRLRVTIEGGEHSKGERRRTFVTPGVGARSLGYDDPTAIRALEQFDQCLQFVLIRSGESLESLLKGRFRDVLERILRDELRKEFAAAEKSRNEYVAALQTGVLSSLQQRIASELGDLFPEVANVSLEPDVRGLDETLTSMRVNVSDTATTDLADKGTGVRGGLIVAMLQYLAQSSRRSIVFAVEEPESFLHPAAQEEMRSDLEMLTTRSDVSLLVTTHSPYIVSRRPDARVISVRKDAEGRTVVDAEANGDQPMLEPLGGLFRSSLIVGYLDRLALATPGELATLVVEGETDRSWLRLAAERSGRPELLEGLTIVVAGDGLMGGPGGATVAAMQALVLKSSSERPVGILLDNDSDGQQSLDLMARLNSKTGGWKLGKNVFCYRDVFNGGNKHFPYEAEDLWPDELHTAYLADPNRKDHLSEQRERPKPEGGYHYGYKSKFKGEFAVYLEDQVDASHCDRWVAMLEKVRSGLGI